MRHPTEGILRRLVDEPAGVTDADRQHVRDCPVCLVGLAEAQQDARLTGAALGAPAAVDADAGWQRLAASIAADQAERAARKAPVVAPTRPRRRLVRRPAIAVLGVAIVLAGATTAAAADWLQIFRTEHIATVQVSEADLSALPDLSAYGDLTLLQNPDVHPAADAAAAEAESGLTVPQVSNLPRGVTGNPVYQVGGQVTAIFTFSAAKAEKAAAASGETLPPVPPQLDGAQFKLTAGPGIAAMWPEARGLPALIVARGVAPSAFSTGVPFTVVRDYLISLPGLPPALADQLRSFTGDGTTLPLPIPEEMASSSTAEVNGHPATVLTSRDGLMAGVVWVDNGVVTAVAGTLSADEVLSVASDLQ